MKNLGGTLYDEIARSATETWKNCYEGKVEVTRKALSPLKTMYDKLMDLTFVEPRVSPIASLINTALESIPKRGLITGATLLMFQGLVSLLRTPQDIVAHGQKILDDQSANSVLSAIIAPPQILVGLDGNSEKSNAILLNIGKLPVPPALESCGLW